VDTHKALSRTSLPVAAVQMEGRIGDVPGNIAQVGDLAEQALRAGARIVALPEFFTTPIIYDERIYQCSLPLENPALDMLKLLANKYEATLGGSYLEKRGDDVYNTYVLVEPSGQVHRHNKDQPTMVENAFYIGGDDPGIAHTNSGKIGIALCWEMIRTRTVSRLVGDIDLMMTGSHWWSAPDWRLGRRLWDWVHRYNTQLMARTPGLFAAMVGAPNLHASHCGSLSGDFQFTQNRMAMVNTVLLGQAQITDASGKILAQRDAREGPGYIQASIELGAKSAVEVPDRFWIDRFPILFRILWHHQNHTAKKSYVQAKRNGLFETYDFSENPPLENTVQFPKMRHLKP